MKTLFFLLLIACCGMVYGQGNLQFNQVITYNIGGIANQYDNVNFTVPAGKVWKIEGCGELVGEPIDAISKHGYDLWNTLGKQF